MAAMQANMKKESIRVATLERQLQDKVRQIAASKLYFDFNRVLGNVAPGKGDTRVVFYM